MATILAYTSPALGNLFPMTSLLLELRQRGHRIVLKTLADGITKTGETGFEVHPIDPRIEAITMTDWQAPNGREALAAAFGIFGERAVHEVDDLRKTIHAEQPDMLLVDVNCWGAAAAAETASLPWALFCPYTPFLRSAGVPPFGPGLRPLPGLLGQLRDAALRPLITGALDKAMLGPMNAARGTAGANAVGSADEFLRRSPLTLVATGEPFEYPHPGWGKSVELIGPCVFDPPVPTPSWFSEIDRPIILVTTSSDGQADSQLPVVAMTAFAANRFIWSRHTHRACR